jgi:signal transduction histidine kinase
MKSGRVDARLVRRWGSLPRRTIRLRLTLIYGGLFIACAAALLAIVYVLVGGQYTADFFVKSGQGVGLTASPGHGSATVITVHGTTESSVPIAATGGGRTSLARVPTRTQLGAMAALQSTAARGTLLMWSGIALAIMALIAMVLGWIVAGRALRPLRAITTTAREISASSLHRRIALAGPDDELKELGSTFDALLERLETAFVAQRQFAANVSHELRTPLTLERTLLEVALADPDANAATLRSVCEKVLSSGLHQERLIDALLVLSRSQRGLERRETLDLAAIAAQALADTDAGGLHVERTLAPAQTDGDPRLIERLAGNLIANAVQYNVPGGRIDVATRTAGGRAILAVANTGPAIKGDDVKRLFEPFQRLDGARMSGGDGVGLGLSIVQAIAEAHGATITTSLPERGGLAIEVAFVASERRWSPARAAGAEPETSEEPDRSRSAAIVRRRRVAARSRDE